ncbi:hypothetical protein ACE6H2_007270 [Prunus campanulata]
MQTRSKSGITKPRHPFPIALFASPPTPSIPTTYKQATKDPRWLQAMNDELTALHRTHTWTLVPPHSAQNLVGSKWVFRIKQHADGSIERYKARLVAKGFNQLEGIDYTETFSPVAKPVTIRILLSIAVQNDWHISQLDVTNAFLHGHLTEEVFMTQPPGFEDLQKPNYVCKLHRSLYGLKQAPRAWYEELHDALLSLGFQTSAADTSLFLKIDSSATFILVYVDDIVITGNNPSYCTQLISQLGSQFAIKDLGPLHYFLGIEVHRTASGLFLSQTKYTTDLLSKTDMLDAKPFPSPATTAKLASDSGELLSYPTSYRSIVGALQYLTWTRPDISYSVNQVCQFLHAPTTTHLTAVKRILRYLKATPDYGLPIHKGEPHLTAFCDADWAGDPNDRRSTTGSCIFLGANLISWSAKKQTTVARSSTEAEYRALATTTADVLWICSLLKELHVFLNHPPLFHCDNISAIALAANPIFHARTKHIEVDYHFIRHLVTSRAIAIQHLPSHSQLADIFTKGLPAERFLTLRSKLITRHPRLRLRGDDKQSNEEHTKITLIQPLSSRTTNQEHTTKNRIEHSRPSSR